MTEPATRLALADFDAVLFDMDGTLVETETIWFEVLRDVARGFGTDVPAEAAAHLHGVQVSAVPEMLAERYGLSVDAQTYLDEVIREVLARLRGAVPRPDAPALVARVAATEKIRAIVSNSSREVVAATLADQSWAAALPQRFSVDDVARGKPHPDLYLHAASALGVDPERCLAIEDSPTGATAAVRAGMTCIAVAFELEPQAFADITPHVAASLADVDRLLT